MSKTTLMVAAVVLGTPALALAQTPADSVLRFTPEGAVYHPNCAPLSSEGALIVYLQGTGLPPEASRAFIRHVGDRTGRCVVAVPYENAKLVASYCFADSNRTTQDADCLDKVLGAKAAGEPERVETRSGGLLEVPRARSAEGGLLAALRVLDLAPYLTDDGDEVRWDRVVLTGGSQGAQVALFIALTRHRVAGVGSIVGGVLPTGGTTGFPAWVTTPGLTSPSLIRAWHHQDDADQFRRSVYRAMRIPDENVRTTAVTGGECATQPHPCVIIDRMLPMEAGLPKVVADWVWVATPEQRAR